MHLQKLVDQLAIARVQGNAEVTITGISIHSRKVKPGELFVCIPGIPGFQEDRHPYAEEAVAAGAAALVVEREIQAAVPTVQVPDARYALAVLAAHFYGYPSSELRLIGVTGTNGKTTTSYLIESILTQAGRRTGLMGNIGTKIGDELFETDLNTQDPPRLQGNLRMMRDRSAEYAVMEVSSQGIHMGRVLGCEFRTAVFTNLTQDHLDYHGTMERYRAAKGLLFSGLGNGFSPDPAKRKFAVLNADDEASAYLREVTAAQTITYGIDRPADVRARDIRLTPRGTAFILATDAGEIAVELQLIGKFNVSNALAAAGAALAEGLSLEEIRRGLSALASVPGRMEAIDEGQDFLVLADYAHTPDGLEKALSTLREFAGGRIITVFGCGGNRDRTKRPVMGQLAARYSDFVILTADNPRSEDLGGILTDIEQGLREAQAPADSYASVPDRGQAIRQAIRLARPGDIVMLAGKGHETYQVLAEGSIPFDDREVAREALRERLR
ncbi:UDP-N-acetylmuramoyl-L-alanyl-D-glutamate--2,6-diaminopimelate ligase [Gorillibacterium sp. sgz500922]|uniref:UDP-N-acetylmuramoyl-L-alanyl-D-glutamate--2, 6-diaminopimelate ligase n=1 Tax=Gorillibacterium sp. sgz500922 TaxID=3446694 RepID=UPI003F68119D